jgi:hypothetical protein
MTEWWISDGLFNCQVNNRNKFKDYFICNTYHKVIWRVPRKPLWVHRFLTGSTRLR